VSVLSEILDMRTLKQFNKIRHTSSEKCRQRQFYWHFKYIAENINYLIQQLRLWMIDLLQQLIQRWQNLTKTSFCSKTLINLLALQPFFRKSLI